MIRRIVLLCVLSAVCYAFYYCWRSFPIATGYGAKVMCSGIFVSGRQQSDLLAEDLNFFPVSFVSYDVSFADSSVTAKLLGVARQKAIFRTGFGATLVNDYTEESIRSQRTFSPSKPHVATDTIAWPMGDRLMPINAAVDREKINRALDKLFADTLRKNTNLTRALIVLYKGQIVAERYAPRISPHTRLTGWSMTKSITGALIGILAQEKKFKIEDPAPVAEWKDGGDPRHVITVRDLLRQSSGLFFEEEYDRSSHATKMLFQRGDAAHLAASQKLAFPPGQVFHYSSGNSNILSRICRVELGDSAYQHLPYEKLFFKIGMYSAVMEPDASGTFVGSSFCYATARDWARFGLLYLNKGKFNGQQVIDSAWIRESVIPAPSATRGEYGFQWWLNKGTGDGANRIYPTLPRDMFYADGYEGQNIFVIPSEELVIVRLGLTRSSQWGESWFINEVIGAIK